MNSIVVNGATYWLPENNADVISLVNNAATTNGIICARGSGHSFPLIETLEKGPVSGRPYTYIMLSNMYSIEMVNPTTVKVQAGCHLGIDPFDPTGISTVENSLCYQLDNMGLALPDLGGITHQTIGGFLSTSSSGGSTQFAFEDALMSLDIVTWQSGTGAAVTTFNRPSPDNPDDPFYAVGIASMGLFGVIVSATFACTPQYYIEGSETTTFTDQCTLIDLFGNNPALPSLEDFLQQTQYTRLMWWPQQSPAIPYNDISRMVVWQAARTDLPAAQAWAANAYKIMGTQPPPGADGLKPYHEVQYILNSPLPLTLGADIIYTAIGRWPNWLQDILGNSPLYQGIVDLVDVNYGTEIFPAILNAFVQNDNDPKNPNKGPQSFSDRWYTGLPMDNQMSDKLMPVWFTELWIDISQSQQVMNTLKTYYDSQPTTPDSSFSVEIYAAKQNEFWLSPAYNLDVIRIDIFWFGNNLGDPSQYYQTFWDLLAPFNFRPHWGKYLPDVINTKSGNQPVTITGPTYISGQYPKWAAWMNLRRQMDPKQIFLNDYWQAHLGIEPV